MDDPGRPDHLWTRRRVLAAAGTGVAGLLAWEITGHRLPGIASPAANPAGSVSFRSRPDLRPPAFRIMTRGRETAPGHLFLTPNSSTAGGSMIADNNGDLVWYRPADTKPTANLRVQHYLGSLVLTWWEGQVQGGHGQGEYVMIDNSYREILRVRAGNGYQGDLHEFLVTPEGTALLTAYHALPADLSPVGGAAQGAILDSVIQEIDIPTGGVLFEWRSHDYVPLTESHSQLASTPGQPFDYFHVNSVDVDTDGHLLVSARNTWAIYKIHRRTGEILWRLGGKNSNFTVARQIAFAWQHDARRHPDGTLTVFDDGAAPVVERQSRGLSMRLDEARGTVALEHQYTHPRALLSGSQGNTQGQPNGNVLIGWGAQPYVSEFSHHGRLVFDGRLPTGVYSYRAFRDSWIGRPTESPAMAVRSAGNGYLAVYASWNGATEVARWEVLAGPSALDLAPVGSAARSGFETTIGLRTKAAFVAVRASDANGVTLGTSAPLRA